MAYWPRVITTTFTVTVDGVAATPILVNGSDTIDLNESRHGVLLDYAKHYLTLKRGGAEMQQSASALQAMLVAAADENALFKESSFFRWAMARDEKPEIPLKVVPQ